MEGSGFAFGRVLQTDVGQGVFCKMLGHAAAVSSKWKFPQTQRSVMIRLFTLNALDRGVCPRVC